MRYLLSTILFFLLSLILPGIVFAATDPSLEAGSLQLSYESTAVPTGADVDVTFSVQELGGEAVQAMAQLTVNGTVVETVPVVLDANESTEFSMLWTVDLLPGSIADLEIRLTEIIPEDPNSANNVLNLIGIQIVEAMMAEESQEEVVSDEMMEESEESMRQPIVIHTEKLSWNLFRFRPALMMAADESAYEWDFGDGTTSNKRVNEHEYAKPGTYQVQLQILTDSGREVTTTQVQVGFFHLANWRLWALLLLLGAIILVAGIIAATSEKGGEDHEDTDLFGTRPEKKEKKHSFFHSLKKGSDDQEKKANASSQPGGNFDLFAESGITQDQLEDELSFLEELKTEDVTSQDESEKEEVTDSGSTISVQPSEPRKIPVRTKKKPVKKKSVTKTSKKKAKKPAKKKTAAKKTNSKKKVAKKTTTKKKTKKKSTKKTVKK